VRPERERGEAVSRREQIPMTGERAEAARGDPDPAPPELVARHALRLIDSPNPPPRITVGDTFQSKIAPFIFRFLPQRIRIWGLKMYYGI